MEPDASSRPLCFRVNRRFEDNRLAMDCQARAYEQALPVVRPSAFAQGALNQVDDAEVVSETVAEKGVAA